MELSRVISGDTVRLVIVGDIDRKGADDLKNEAAQIDLRSCKVVALDFAKVTHIGSAGLGKLLMLYKKFSTANINLRVDNASAEIGRLLREMKMDALFTVA